MLRFVLLFALWSGQASTAPTSGVAGLWRSPGGGVIEVAPCGPSVCAKLVGLAPEDMGKLDGNNPDTAARTHPLCGLQIGTGFHLIDPSHADDGKLYDPKTGKTYHGTMTAEGGELHLHGYVGMKAFGRTETWMRVDRSAMTCPKPAAGS